MSERIDEKSLPEDFPREELQRRLDEDHVLATLVRLKEKADAKCKHYLDLFEARLEKLRENFKTNTMYMSAVDKRDYTTTRVRLRRQRILSKLSREYWVKKNRERLGKDKTTPTPPPNETSQGQSNGLLEGQNLDGARTENADDQMHKP